MANRRTALATIALLLTACDGPPSSVGSGAPGDVDGGDEVDAGAATDGGPPPDAAGPPIDGAPDPDAPPGDLTINPARAIADMAIGTRVFSASECELDPDEDCVAAAGARRLLYFAVETPNVGDNDVFLGRPSPDNPRFVFSSCHGHYHFLGFAEYALVDAADNELAVGRKQAFCLVDSQPYLPGAEARPALYTCGFQGIQAGWSDVYDADLPCQFLDITGVPDGDYTLVLRVNTENLLPETRTDNNEARIPIAIGNPDLESPTEPCPALDDHSTAGPHRECGWELAATFACEPGRDVALGCAATCGLGECTGNPMLRVCDGAAAQSGGPSNCHNQRKLGGDTDACGSSCPRVGGLTCPDSGNLTVYAAPETVGSPYSCRVELRE